MRARPLNQRRRFSDWAIELSGLNCGIGLGRRGAQFRSARWAKGPKYPSPGQRPGFTRAPGKALKGRDKSRVDFCAALSGLFSFFQSLPRALPHRHLVKRDGEERRWMASLRAPCVAIAEGPSLRVALSRGVWHGARSDAIHQHSLLASTPKLNASGATPWAGLLQPFRLRDDRFANTS